MYTNFDITVEFLAVLDWHLSEPLSLLGGFVVILPNRDGSPAPLHKNDQNRAEVAGKKRSHSHIFAIEE